jgi:hypothetical protein
MRAILGFSFLVGAVRGDEGPCQNENLDQNLVGFDFDSGFDSNVKCDTSGSTNVGQACEARCGDTNIIANCNTNDVGIRKWVYGYDCLGTISNYKCGDSVDAPVNKPVTGQCTVTFAEFEERLHGKFKRDFGSILKEGQWGTQLEFTFDTQMYTKMGDYSYDADVEVKSCTDSAFNEFAPFPTNLRVSHSSLTSTTCAVQCIDGYTYSSGAHRKTFLCNDNIVTADTSDDCKEVICKNNIYDTDERTFDKVYCIDEGVASFNTTTRMCVCSNAAEQEQLCIENCKEPNPNWALFGSTDSIAYSACYNECRTQSGLHSSAMTLKTSMAVLLLLLVGAVV